MENRTFAVANSPHVHDNSSIQKIMWNVFLALIPATFVSVYAFGFQAARVIAVSTIAAVVFEYIALLFMKRDWRACFDGSAAVTGLLLGLTLPSNISTGIILIGSFVAIIIAKQVFGGLGHNPFNPALTARVFLLIAFPGPLTTWPLPRGLENASKFMGVATTKVADAVTTATPLGAIKQNAVQAMPNININDLVFGLQTPGSIGEISALALLLGGIWLLYKKIITWHIPVAVIASVGFVALITWRIDPKHYADPFFHFFAGGLFIGAFFMATDYVTAPIFSTGKLIYGAGVGLLTIIIRLWGGYPEGISFAILIMNAVTPLLDRWTVPKPFGFQKVRSKS
ncbi:RnfABCDGE type electron transport complex subunit D [Myxococcota bacterium]|nr:RnfABCDGE type electron transport complex subunit D [Myxococcota bacterium]MBU1537256.1 RnfABCDGE type electron transport complex subunit D [Myxococcota bacterium]